VRIRFGCALDSRIYGNNASLLQLLSILISFVVLFFQAVDPENDPVTYSIVSGNDLRQFAIGDKTGVITVIRKLDREDLTRYQLVCIVTEVYYILHWINPCARFHQKFLLQLKKIRKRDSGRRCSGVKSVEVGGFHEILSQTCYTHIC
jgi:hypothetical protein